MKFRKFYNANCYRIHFTRTMRKRSAQEQHLALSHPPANQFHCHYRPANSAFANKPHKTTRSFNPHNFTRTPINSYTYSHNGFFPTPTLSSLLQLFNFELPPPKLHPLKYYYQNYQQIAKVKPNTHDQFYFLFKKIMNL